MKRATLEMSKTDLRIAQLEDEIRQLKTQLQQAQDELKEKEHYEAMQEELLRKTMEAEENNIRLSLLMDASKSGLWTVNVVNAGTENPELSYIFSDQFRKILGFSDEHDFPNELNCWSERLHPYDKHKAQEAYFRHLLDRSGKTHFNVEYRIMKKNGEYAYIHDICSTIRNEKGYPLHLIGAIRDITELKLAEQNIIEEKERIEALGNNLPDVALFQVVDDTKLNHLCFSYVSGSWESITGIPGDVAINDADKVFDAVHPDDLPLVIQAIDESVRRLRNFYIETRFIVDGRTRWLQVSASLHRKDSLIYADGTLLDITHRIEAERQLIHEKNRLQMLNDNIPGGALFQIVRHNTTRQMRILYVGATWESVTGIAPDAILANINKLFAYIHPDDLPLLLQTIDNSVTNMNDIDVEVRAGERWLHIFSRPRREETGIVWDGIILNISERKNYETALAESQSKLKLISDNTKDIFWIADFKTFKYTFVTGALFELSGYTNEEFCQKKLTDVVSPQSKKEAEDLFEQTVKKYYETGILDSINQEFLAFGKDGLELWLETSMQILTDKKGELSQIIGVTRNIDARKRIEAELAKYRENLELLVQQRTDELNSANEELVSANEELTSSNEELAVTNEQLVAANEELDRYRTQLEEMVKERTKEVIKEKVRLQTLVKNIPNGYLLRVGLKTEILSLPNAQKGWFKHLEFMYASDDLSLVSDAPPEDARDNFAMVFMNIHDDDRRPLANRLFESMRSLTVFTAEIRFFRSENDLRWHRIACRPSIEEDYTMVDWLILDITEQKNNELALVKIQSNLELLVQQRTDELNTANEELVSANEELSSSNEELAVTNEELTSTNEELDRYKIHLEEMVEEKAKEAMMEKNIIETLIQSIPNATMLRFQLNTPVESLAKMPPETAWREYLQFVDTHTDFETGGKVLYGDEINSMQDVLGVFDRYHPEDIITFRTNMFESMCSLSKVSLELRYLYPENEVQWHYFVLRPFRENENIFFDIYIIDITGQK